MWYSGARNDDALQPVAADRLLRGPPPGTTPVMSGDSDRYFGYHVWTCSSYGRKVNSVRNSIADPRMVIEQMFGVPVHRIAQGAQKVRGPLEVAEGLVSGRL